MSWREVERDLGRLAEDARGMVDDVRGLGADLGRQAERASEDVVAAEYLATGNLLEWTTGWFDDGRESLAIAARQWRLLFEDGLTTSQALVSARTAGDLAAIPGDHVRRRVDHVRGGFDETRALMDRSLQRSLEPLRTVWRPFLSMLRDDWRR
ncbi:MAG TPA: hypothetical protein VLA56_08085 [Pseudomonadales bacterium]|nr:hypothetical protein [Pseudomonadales bacterium]